VYRSVASTTKAELSENLERVDASDGLAVLVGAASRLQTASLTLSAAYALARNSFPRLPIGGVLIAERHEVRHAEHERALQKMDAGCRYFISQAVYSVAASKNLLSDLYYLCQEKERPMPPILVTLSPCGSPRTLEFMRWLGISVPRWLENDLRHAKDILQTSIDVCTDVLEDLHDFARARGIPLGCNVESVSLSKVEIDASVELVARAARCLGR
jgi:5,10-methylenetetrahydrofolate reductase